MKLNRRSFLKKALAAGSLAAGTGSFISACSGIRRSDLPDQNLSGLTANQLDTVGNSILYHASLAPSGHNAQPWYVRVLGPKEWIIGADPDRRLPAVDPGNREAMLSIGAFAENLSIAAGTFGQKAEMEVIAKDPFAQEVIKVRLRKAKPVERMVLTARERKLAIQPMTQYLEEESGLKQIAAEHEQRVFPHFVLRIGYLNTYPDPVSLRRPVNWFVRL